MIMANGTFPLGTLRMSKKADVTPGSNQKPMRGTLHALTDEVSEQEAVLRHGGGTEGHQRQRERGRLPVRERLPRLLDDDASFLELGLWAAYRMYAAWGEIPAAGVVAGIGRIHGRPCMVIANDATVKAGAFFPQTAKKVLRAQWIAHRCSLPVIYLVDSSGVFLPLQDEIIPDEDDFGRVFRNNAVLSAAGIPQYAAIMGNCVAGGAYLPVLCDKVLMTEGSALYLAGPALAKAAIGQIVDEEELGGARMHSELSGTIDFCEPNDEACLDRLRNLVKLLPAGDKDDEDERRCQNVAERDPQALYDLISSDGTKPYDARDLLACLVDQDSLNEYKADYGQTLLTAYASVGGRAVGIVANQHKPSRSKKSGLQLGGVIYGDSAEKAARVMMDCNQMGLPISRMCRASWWDGTRNSGASFVAVRSSSTW